MSPDAPATERTVLFADIVDSTGLYEALGDARAQETLQRCMDLMEEIAVDCGGAVEKRIGDEVLCTFPAPAEAARAAERMHMRVVGGQAKGLFPRPMRLRIGFEHGEVLEREGELFGSSVHTAARLAALAKAGQTLTSLETLECIASGVRPLHRPFDRVQLKGQKEAREVVELLWSRGSTMLAPQPVAVRKDGGVEAVSLTTDAGSVRVDAVTGVVSLGRDEICELSLEGDAVSRLHAKVTLDHGRAHFEDMSSNGSAVIPEAGERQEVRREAVLLRGRGVLRLGLHCPDAQAAFVRYECIARAPAAEPASGA